MSEARAPEQEVRSAGVVEGGMTQHLTGGANEHQADTLVEGREGAGDGNEPMVQTAFEYNNSPAVSVPASGTDHVGHSGASEVVTLSMESLIRQHEPGIHKEQLTGASPIVSPRNGSSSELVQPPVSSSQPMETQPSYADTMSGLQIFAVQQAGLALQGAQPRSVTSDAQWAVATQAASNPSNAATTSYSGERCLGLCACGSDWL